MVSISDNGNLKVRLNLGYGFTNPFILEGSRGILSSSAETSSLSLSGFYNIKASSFSAGCGASTTRSNDNVTLKDVNGDGLLDYIWTDMDGVVKARLNLGNCFSNYTIELNGLYSIRTNSSTAASIHGTYTIGVPIALLPIRFVFTPGISHNESISRTEMDLRDVTGDGFLDLICSDNEDSLKVYRSLIGRTNKLKTVSNSLGGKFTIDYKHNMPTYGLPGGKWVMSSVEVDYGIHGDYEIPNTKNVFEYNNGRRDRHEREFLGFGQVITKSIDTQNDLSLYRQVVEEYDTASIYTAGNLLRTYAATPTDAIMTETTNEYYHYGLKNTSEGGINGGKYSFSSNFPLWNDRGVAYCPLKYSESVDYEGTSTALTMSEQWRSYYTRPGDHGLLATYKYSDQGSLKIDGSGAYNYITHINYTNNQSGNHHIIGQPSQVNVSNSSTCYHYVTAQYAPDHAGEITQVRHFVRQDPHNEFDSLVIQRNNLPLGLGDNATDITVPTDPGFPTIPDSGTPAEPAYAEYAMSDYTYDTYGNLSSVTHPQANDGNRFTRNYIYEDTLHTYLARIVDSFGLTSREKSHDFRYGTTLHTEDCHSQNYKCGYDDVGRLSYVQSPKDVGYNYKTITFSYNAIADIEDGKIVNPASATTTYNFRLGTKDGDNTMRVVTFVDGFGRPIQVRKDGVVWEDGTNVDKVIVSGRVDYDPYGRVVKTYYPSAEQPATIAQYDAKAQSSEYGVVTGYDILDRKSSETLPDNTTTTYAYDIKDGSLRAVVTDAKGHRSETYTNGSGNTVKSVQFKNTGNSQALTTQFEYDGIGRLVKVIDTEGNETLSSYDMADNRTKVVHPASGETTYTYDLLGNVLTRQTASLKGEGESIRYTYDYGMRLTHIAYPEHPENDVRYYYGSSLDNELSGLRGRVKFRSDGSGGTEYDYDAMGNVKKIRRTIVVPGQMVATADFEWEYDSFGKLIEMRYPGKYTDNELVVYQYDHSGQLQMVYNGTPTGFHYVDKIGYDRFGDRVHISYGNGTATDYTYIPTNRRLGEIVINGHPSAAGAFSLTRSYSYDNVGNITKLTSSGTNLLYPSVNHTYTYDALSRLTKAEGITSTGNQAKYTQTFTYDDMYRITKKTNVMQQSDVQFDGALYAGYTLGYSYNKEAGKRFRLSSVSDVNYRSLTASTTSSRVTEGHTYEYDANGNILRVATSRKRTNGNTTPVVGEGRFRWDEENRLMAISQNGYVSHYFYDADGERTIKMHNGMQSVFVNGEQSAMVSMPLQFSAYFNPYFTIHDGTRFTKHLYIGSERIASMTGELRPDYYEVNNPNKKYAGVNVGINSNEGMGRYYNAQMNALGDSVSANYRHFDLPAPPMPSTGGSTSLAMLIDDETMQGETGNAANHPEELQASMSQTSGTASSSQAQYNGNIWYFHSDHLGSSSLITDRDGAISQQIEYLPYGEVFLEKQPQVAANNQPYQTPYRFNGKELDEETGLYYYGARYMNPRLSIWYGTDRLELKYPNISSYAYCAGNPIVLYDCDGLEVRPMSDLALEIIKLGLSRSESEYVQLNGDGLIDLTKLRQGKMELSQVGDNYSSLLTLVDNKSIIEVYTSNKYSTSKGDFNMSNVSYDSELDVMYNIDYTANGLSKEQYASLHPSLSSIKDWNGFLGISLYPDEGYVGTTLNGNIQIVINDNPLLVDKTNGLMKMTSTFAHEGYGHVKFKLLGLPHSHGSIKSLDPTTPGNNFPLEKQIKERENEAEQNFKNHNYLE